ncbi:MAG: hypothetical protein V8R75_05730 [Oscillospiraceae bacterium]
MMKKLTALILALGMVLSLCACGGEAGAPDSQDGGTVSGLVDVPTSGQDVVQTAVTLIAGKKLGIWEKLGLNVTRTHYVSGPPQLEANPAGDWDIGWIGATAAITGVFNYDMKVICLSGFDYSNMAFAAFRRPHRSGRRQGCPQRNPGHR